MLRSSCCQSSCSPPYCQRFSYRKVKKAQVHGDCNEIYSTKLNNELLKWPGLTLVIKSILHYSTNKCPIRKRKHCFARPFAHQLSSLTVNAPSAHCPPSLNELSLIARLQLFYIQLFHIQLSRVKSLSVQKTLEITAHHVIATRKRPSIPAAR